MRLELFGLQNQVLRVVLALLRAENLREDALPNKKLFHTSLVERLKVLEVLYLKFEGKRFPFLVSLIVSSHQHVQFSAVLFEVLESLSEIISALRTRRQYRLDLAECLQRDLQILTCRALLDKELAEPDYQQLEFQHRALHFSDRVLEFYLRMTFFHQLRVRSLYWNTIIIDSASLRALYQKRLESLTPPKAEQLEAEPPHEGPLYAVLGSVAVRAAGKIEPGKIPLFISKN